MAKICNVCGRKLLREYRFCPGCGIEVLDESPRQVVETRRASDHLSWETELPGESDDLVQEYSIAEQSIDLGWVREKLQRAAELLSQGQVRQGAGILDSLGEHLGDDPDLRQQYKHLAKAVSERRGKAIQRARRLVSDPDRLMSYLTGPAVDLLAPDELGRAALEAANRLYEHDDAEKACQMLRLPLFKDVTDPRLRARHRRLKEYAWRRAQRQQFVRNAAVFAVVLISGVAALVVWIWFLLQVPTWASILVSALAAVAIFAGLRPLRRWLQLKLGEGFEETG